MEVSKIPKYSKLSKSERVLICKWGAKEPLKNSDIYSYVLDNLRAGWSPEVISGRLRKVDHKGEPHYQICSETIYHFIYSKNNK